MTTLLINTVDQMNCYYISKRYSLPLEKGHSAKNSSCLWSLGRIVNADIFFIIQ